MYNQAERKVVKGGRGRNLHSQKSLFPTPGFSNRVHLYEFDCKKGVHLNKQLNNFKINIRVKNLENESLSPRAVLSKSVKASSSVCSAIAMLRTTENKIQNPEKTNLFRQNLVKIQKAKSKILNNNFIWSEIQKQNVGS